MERASGDYTITQDADLEYDPSDYRRLLSVAVDRDCDAVYGSRLLGQDRYHRYAGHYWSVRALTSLTNALFGSAYTDVATNYKLVRTSVLKSLDLTCTGFDLDFQVSNQLAIGGFRVVEAPISFLPRSYEDGKKIRARDGLLAIKAIARDWANFRWRRLELRPAACDASAPAHRRGVSSRHS